RVALGCCCAALPPGVAQRKRRPRPVVGKAPGGGGLAWWLQAPAAAWLGTCTGRRERWATARAQAAVGADCDAPLGQDVLQEAAHTLCGGERAVAPRAPRALLDAAGDV